MCGHSQRQEKRCHRVPPSGEEDSGADKFKKRSLGSSQWHLSYPTFLISIFHLSIFPYVFLFFSRSFPHISNMFPYLFPNGVVLVASSLFIFRQVGLPVSIFDVSAWPKRRVPPVFPRGWCRCYHYFQDLPDHLSIWWIKVICGYRIGEYRWYVTYWYLFYPFLIPELLSDSR